MYFAAASPTAIFIGDWGGWQFDSHAAQGYNEAAELTTENAESLGQQGVQVEHLPTTKTPRHEERGVIDRVDGEQAVIVLEDGQRLLWPTGELPDGAAEGTAVVLTLALAADAETQRRRDQVAALQAQLNVKRDE